MKTTCRASIEKKRRQTISMMRYCQKLLTTIITKSRDILKNIRRNRHVIVIMKIIDSIFLRMKREQKHKKM
jgi:hypothetical protein